MIDNILIESAPFPLGMALATEKFANANFSAKRREEKRREGCPCGAFSHAFGALSYKGPSQKFPNFFLEFL